MRSLDPRLGGFEAAIQFVHQAGKVHLHYTSYRKSAHPTLVFVNYWQFRDYLGSLKNGRFYPKPFLHSLSETNRRNIWFEMQAFRADPLKTCIAFGKETITCAICNRPLTDPTSIERGIGPECYKKVTHFSLDTLK